MATAGSVTVRLNLSSAGYSAEMTKAEAQMKRLQASTMAMGHSTVSSMQASSAAIRVMEGNLANNVRAAERFVSLIPGMGAALQTAFPVVGAIALLGVLSEMVERVGNFTAKLKDIPDNPFAGVINSSKLSNDALAITNDRLQLEIEKLEKKPQNRMALALDQMKDSADKLFDSLDKSNKAFDEAMGKGGIGTLKGTWRNETPTDAADADIKRARAGVEAVKADHKSTIDDALASGDPNNVKQAREALMVDLQNAYQAQDSALRAGLEKAQQAAKDFHGSYSVGSDPRAVVQRYSSALQVSAQDQQTVGGQYGNSLLTGQRDADQGANDQTELATAAAKKQFEAMEDALKQTRAQYGISIAGERSYWQQREAAFTAGSDAYRAVVNKVADLEIQMQRQEAEALKAARSQQTSGSRDSSRVLEAASAAVSAMMKREGEDVLQTGERWRAYNEAVMKAGEIMAANAASFDKTRIAIELASGQISKLDAAQQLAGVHAQQYASDLATLQKQRQQIGNDGDLTDVQRATALKQNSDSTTALQGQRQVQILEDQQDISGNTIPGAAKDALNQMVTSFTDLAANLKAVIPQTIEGLNADIVKAMTGQGKRADFGRTLQAGGQGLLKAALEKVEGTALKGLGLGKADGSRQNPWYVVPLQAGGAMGAAQSSPFFRPFIGGQQQGSQDSGGKSSGGSFWGNLGSTLMKSFFGGNQNSGGGSGGGGDGIGDSDGGDGAFQGGFSSGGDILANRPAHHSEPSTRGRRLSHPLPHRRSGCNRSGRGQRSGHAGGSPHHLGIRPNAALGL
jgi:hypothetical protein